MELQRTCAVAGSFYPAKREVLEKEVLELLGENKKSESRSRALGIIVPHAGYRFSGRFAAAAYSSVNLPETVVILCPNHSGRGKQVSVWPKGSWETPLGNLDVNEEFCDKLLSVLNETPDTEAHEYEHAIEVQLPFIYCINPKTKIVPICLGHLSYEECSKIGEALANTIEDKKENYLLIASTDMSHYISAEKARVQDMKALDKIKQLNSFELYRTVVDEDISMCGFIPTTIVVESTYLLGAVNAKLLSYGHSGEVTKDDRSVVAYASLLIQ